MKKADTMARLAEAEALKKTVDSVKHVALLPFHATKVDPVLWTLVLGANDRNSVLHCAKRIPRILKKIAQFLRYFWQGEWDPRIVAGDYNIRRFCSSTQHIYASIVG